jgi:hypothetical protein
MQTWTIYTYAKAGGERVPDQFIHEDAGDVVPFCWL